MKKTLIIALIAFVGLAHSGAKAQDDRGFEIAKNLEIFSSVYKALNQNYVDDVDPGKTIKVAIDAMLGSLDPYTNYFPESQMEDVKLQLLGEYGGIGSLIMQRGDSVYISEPYEGLPAADAGIMAGDRIVAVDGQSTRGKNTQEVSSIMRGQAGTEVTLRLEREGKEFDVTLKRREIKLPNVPYYGFVGKDKDYGYIKLDEFTTDAAKHVREAFVNLKKEKPSMKGCILDLRGNGGGLMNEAVDIVNIWVPKGTLVVETKGKVASKNLKSFTRMAPEDTEIPLAVLIDGSSASASEIVSGSLQDLDRAVIIGQRSYGKGLVQNILPMAYNSQMKVTVSKYYIPSGRCIQAIDYSQRDENGRAVRVPDSLKTAFKTKAGRTVYDGFGIEPDVEVEPEYMSNLGIALAQKFLVFDYATQYRRTHKEIAPADEFEISDELYDDFCRYLKEKKLSYSTVTERVIKELREVAQQEKYDSAINAQLELMEKTLEQEKQSDLQKHRTEVCEMLKAELLNRYYYDRGRVQGALRDDKTVAKAIDELKAK
ncbi:MAG: PDZ domain-containing protein [Bacteroidales bacterium]|nr:PDZ domain-containing protein [Bacteroidales bacterium]